MNWATPTKRKSVGWVGGCTRRPRNTDMDPAFSNFNLPLEDPESLCDETGVCPQCRTSDAIAPSNEQLRRSVEQFAPPAEWFNDDIEQQVW
jgi:hypothetical protein